MSGLRLTLKSQPQQSCIERLDMTGIVPDKLLALDVADIAQLTIKVDRRTVAVHQMFDIQDGDRQSMILRGDFANADCVGGGMRDGLLVVEGAVGQRLAEQMRGGQLIVHGDVGDQACANLLGGLVLVHGSAGDYLGGAVAGTRRGMRGGSCYVLGSAGRHTAFRMRRGTLVVTGSVDAACASSLVAGTVILFGAITGPLSVGMRRGTVLCIGAEQPSLPVGFTPFEPIELSYLPLLFQSLRTHLPESLVSQLTSGAVHRSLGDRASGGTGEVLWVTVAP